LSSNDVLPSFCEHFVTVFNIVVGGGCGDILFKFAVIVSENQLLGRSLMRTPDFLLSLLKGLCRIVTPRSRTVLLCDPPGEGSLAWLDEFILQNSGTKSLNSDLFVVCRWCLHSVPFGLISEIDVFIFPIPNQALTLTN